MNFKNATIISLAAFLYCGATFATQTIAQALGWESTQPTHDNLCGGHYVQPLSISQTPNPLPYQTIPVTITAKGPATFRSDGVSILKDDVVILQPGRLVRADKAYIYRDNKTGKIIRIKLIGHVHIQEYGKLLVGETADYNIADNTLTMNKGIYHIVGVHQLISVTTPFDAWGTADFIDKKSDGVIHLKNVQYSTCAPDNPAWIMSASKMELDRNKGEGYAHNVVMRFKKIPIFYTPYYSFPINAARESGFLAPAFGYSAEQGMYYTQPYYWNMAPNYDLLFTPRWYTQRGVQLNSYFRYLTAKSDGALYASFMPYDRQFAQYRHATLNNPPNVPAAYLNELANTGNDRAFIDFTNHIQFNKLWSAKVYARYVSDSYFAQDYQSEFLTQNTNQLPSFAELDYQGDHWHNTFIGQTYQTLHPITQFNNAAAQNQYTRLPEIDSSAAYPNFLPGYNFNFSGQVVHFDYTSAYTPLTYQMPIGNRLHLQPSISRPFTWSSFYLTPQLTADSTNYFAQLPSIGPTTPRPAFNANRMLPIADIDTGLYLDRSIHVGKSDYIQTLEPRLFYLYTPYINQDNFPNFDTQLLPFSVTNLYSLNQFTGYDRLENANQLTVGLSSRILRSADATNILSAQLGFINYFTNPHVCLLPDCKIVRQPISPITGALTWSPNTFWAINSQAAWDTALKQVNNAQVGVQYRFDDHHIILFSYQFAHGSTDRPPFDPDGFSTNASLLSVGLAWPITLHWNFIGYTFYDLTHRHPENQYIGLSYDTCCWALRAIISDNFVNMNAIATGNGTKFVNQYSTNYYFEFLLKGLGSAGTQRAEDMLTSTLPGFQDIFSNRGHYGYSQNI